MLRKLGRTCVVTREQVRKVKAVWKCDLSSGFLNEEQSKAKQS